MEDIQMYFVKVNKCEKFHTQSDLLNKDDAIALAKRWASEYSDDDYLVFIHCADGYLNPDGFHDTVGVAW
jgi:hypothetical protein